MYVLIIISDYNIMISTTAYLQKEDAIKTSQGWWTLSEKHVRVRQLLAHYTTRFEAYISSKARLTQSLEYSRNEQ